MVPLLKPLWDDFAKAFPPLISVVVAILLAKVWTQSASWPLFAAMCMVGLLFAVLVAGTFDFADRVMVVTAPKRAWVLMEVSRVSYFITAAVAGAVAIRVGLALSPTQPLDAATKELVEIFGSGVAAFATASVASIASEKSDETLGKQIKAAFQARYLYEDTAYRKPDSGKWVPLSKDSESHVALVYAVHDLNVDWAKRSSRASQIKAIKTLYASLDPSVEPQEG